MSRITTLRPAPMPHASRPMDSSRAAARPLRGLQPQRPAVPQGPASPLQAPRGRATRCAATSDDMDMAPSAHALSLTLALGGSRRDAAVRSSPLAALEGAALAMQREPDAGTRRAFVHALIQREDSAALVAPFAQDPDMAVRHALVQNAWLWRQPTARAVLRAVAGNPQEHPWVAQAAVRTLASHAESDALLAMRQDSRPWVRLAVAEGLGKIAPHGLVGMLQDPDASVRAAALGEIAAPVSHSTLQAVGDVALRDPMPWVRHIAMRLLAQHDRGAAHRIVRQVRGPLQAVLVGTLTRLAPHPPERWAGDLLRGVEEMAGVRYLHDMPELHRDRASDPHVSDASRRTARVASLEAAVQILRDAGSYSHALQHAEALLRQTTDEVELLGLLSGPGVHHLANVVPALDRLRQSPHVDVRRSLPGILRQLPREATTLPMLAAMAHDSDTQVRRAVAAELFQLSNARTDHAPFLPIVRQLLGDPVPAVREAAARALRELKAPGSVDLQALAARDTDGTVRKATVWDLCHRRTPEAAAALRMLAQDGDFEIRETVARALGHMPMELAFPMLSVFLQDAHPGVRKNFIWALYMHARDARTAPRAAELALRGLDAAEHADEALAEELSKTRSQVLAEALVALSDNRAMLEMLHGWVAAFTHVDTAGIERLAACDYPQRGALLAQLLESPHDAVRETTRGVVARLLAAQSRA